MNTAVDFKDTEKHIALRLKKEKKRKKRHFINISTLSDSSSVQSGCTCVHGCLVHPGASAASLLGVRGWEWLWTGGCRIQQLEKRLPRGQEEWAPSPSPLPPPAHRAAGTCERGAWGTACLDRICQQTQTCIVSWISLNEMNVFIYWSQESMH